MTADQTASDRSPALSVVIPVYNGARTISTVVDRIKEVFATTDFEIILVNDGSEDASEAVCGKLANDFSSRVILVQLSKNFGEHNAVLAGLKVSQGQNVAVIDDDGQNPPEEIPRLLAELKQTNCDVVYGHYREKRHSWFRNLGSRFNDRIATLMLRKPKDLYLSSFKVMNRFVVDEITKYSGPFPYTDGLIYRTTRKIRQVEVEHLATDEPSRYTLVKLIALWLNMFLNFSITPLRLSIYAGLITSCLSLVALLFILIDKLWISPDITHGIPTVLAAIVCLSGLQLMILGLVGEYLGRLYLGHTGTPQYIVRYTTAKKSPGPPVNER